MPSALETALQLSQSGKSDFEIMSEMKEMGFSAREISEAINELKIKKSIMEKPISGTSETGDMEPSIMEKPVEEEIEVPKPLPFSQPEYKKAKNQIKNSEEAPYSYQPEQQYYPQYQQAQQPQYYSEQPPQQAIDIELVEEIAEEAANEKFNEFKNKIGDISGFKQITEKRIEDIDERLKRIELNLDKIQISLLGKMKEYGENIKVLGGEMQNVEDSFSKILNPLISNVKELNALTEKIKERAVSRVKDVKRKK